MAEIDQVPVPGGGTGVSQPDSPYGAIADLDRLKAELPTAAGGAGPMAQGPGGPLGPAGSPPMGGGGGGFAPSEGGGGPLDGLPPSIADPTTMPDVAVDSPLAPDSTGSQMGGPLSPSQNRLRVLEALRQSDDTETKEWAEMMLRLLTER